MKYAKAFLIGVAEGVLLFAVGILLVEYIKTILSLL